MGNIKCKTFSLYSPVNSNAESWVARHVVYEALYIVSHLSVYDRPTKILLPNSKWTSHVMQWLKPSNFLALSSSL